MVAVAPTRVTPSARTASSRSKRPHAAGRLHLHLRRRTAAHQPQVVVRRPAVAVAGRGLDEVGADLAADAAQLLLVLVVAGNSSRRSPSPAPCRGGPPRPRPRCRRPRSVQSPLSTLPMFTTMSSSRAPSAIAWRGLGDLDRGDVAAVREADGRADGDGRAGQQLRRPAHGVGLDAHRGDVVFAGQPAAAAPGRRRSASAAAANGRSSWRCRRR